MNLKISFLFLCFSFFLTSSSLIQGAPVTTPWQSHEILSHDDLKFLEKYINQMPEEQLVKLYECFEILGKNKTFTIDDIIPKIFRITEKGLLWGWCINGVLSFIIIVMGIHNCYKNHHKKKWLLPLFAKGK